ncbi:uncharacterized protein LOC115222756 [Argonauta hians]
MIESCSGNIFGEITQNNVVFCIETSAKMLSSLPLIKRHLELTLERMAANEKKIYFNIIEFNSTVLAWADKLICSTFETVHMAINWLSKLSARSGCSTLDALRMALKHNRVDAVYLVTSSKPYQHTDVILDEIIPLSKGCPIHCIYLTDQHPDDDLENLLEDLSIETRGSFSIYQTSDENSSFTHPKLIFSSNNERENIIRSSITGHRYTPEKMCSVTGTLQVNPNLVPNPYPVMYPLSVGLTSLPKPICYPAKDVVPYYFSKACLTNKHYEVSPYLSPGAASLLIGKKVLAQNYQDGYFYMGEVHSQIRTHDFLVALNLTQHQSGRPPRYNETNYQETSVCDIIDYQEASRHAILEGDTVLAPPSAQQPSRFACGRVLEGREGRNTKLKDPDMDLVVTFENGRTFKVPRNMAVWIPKNIFDHIKVKVHQPASLKRVPNYRRPHEIPATVTIEPRIWSPAARGLENFYHPYHQFISTSYFPIIPAEYNVTVPASYGIPYYPHSATTTGGGGFSYPRCRSTVPRDPHYADEECRPSSPTTDLHGAPFHKLTINELDCKDRHKNNQTEDVGVDANGNVNKQLSVTTGQLKEQLSPTACDDGEKQKEVTADVYYPELSEPDEKSANDSLKFNPMHNKDSCLYRTSTTATNLPDLGFYDDNGVEELYEKNTKDIGVNTECLKFLGKPNDSGKQPMWKYWAKNPTRKPSPSKPNFGAFRETLVDVPFELRDRRQYEDYASNSSFRYVDRFSRHRQNDSVAALMIHEPTSAPAPPAPPSAPASLPAQHQQGSNPRRTLKNDYDTPGNRGAKECIKPSELLGLKDGGTKNHHHHHRQQQNHGYPHHHNHKNHQHAKKNREYMEIRGEGGQRDMEKAEKILKTIIADTNATLNRQEQINITHAAKKALNNEIYRAVAGCQHKEQQVKPKGNVVVKAPTRKHQQQQEPKCQGNGVAKSAPAKFSSQPESMAGACVHSKGQQQYVEACNGYLSKDQQAQQRRYEKSQQKWADVYHKVLQKESMEDQKRIESQKNRIRQIDHFARLEEQGQKRKYGLNAAREQQLYLYRSKVLL